jgi:hypothetical protein
MKKIAVTLDGEAEQYFYEVAYSLDTDDGKLATHSDIINHCLAELGLFERIAGQSLTDYLEEGWPGLIEKSKIEFAQNGVNIYLNSTDGKYNNSDKDE